MYITRLRFPVEHSIDLQLPFKVNAGDNINLQSLVDEDILKTLKGAVKRHKKSLEHREDEEVSNNQLEDTYLGCLYSVISNVFLTKEDNTFIVEAYVKPNLINVPIVEEYCIGETGETTLVANNQTKLNLHKGDRITEQVLNSKLKAFDSTEYVVENITYYHNTEKQNYMKKYTLS